MYKKCEVPVSQLRKNADLSKIKFKTTSEIQSLDSVIGQDRAVKAINFGLAMEDPSYNIFVTGFRGTGRTTTSESPAAANAPISVSENSRRGSSLPSARNSR